MTKIDKQAKELFDTIDQRFESDNTEEYTTVTSDEWKALKKIIKFYKDDQQECLRQLGQMRGF